ncbi:hypothetical protein BC941DRAFT_426924 [Chlamydoabsidia padenii]|nr:hypothetical protein BC941DRAFT_426924 [Chlamydoabsidia padenii]
MTTGIQSSIADLTTETRSTSGEIPPPLVGASTTIVGNHMYVFGGRLVASRQMTNHLYILDLTTLVWERHIGPPDSCPPPQPRYFHSANIYNKSLVIFGGMSHAHRNSATQGLCALDDLCLFDLETLSWVYPQVSPSIFTPQARYAHLAECAHDKLMVIGGQDMSNQYINEINIFDLKLSAWVQGGPVDQQYGAYRAVAFCPLPINKGNSPLWPQSDNNNDIPLCMYSNYNFADVTRDLQSCRPLHDHPVTFKDHSDDMSGTLLPPGLRFPSGHLLGHHMIMTGTYLTPTHRSFHLWALNLANLVWVRVDTGSILSAGSWNRGVLHHDQQKFYVVGNRDRDLLEDYNHRQINFDHVAIVDLEAFGIYTHPESTCAPIAQELGLSMLNEPNMADMEIISTDRKSIPINSTVLAQRWKYFADLMDKEGRKQQKRLQFTESYAVTLAFLQYLYTDHLMTAQQHQPNILSRLLILAHMFDMPRLIQLTTHALHQILTISTASMVYEAAALTCRTALQIRALRVMINTRKMLQQQQQLNSTKSFSPPPVPMTPSYSSSIHSTMDDHHNVPYTPNSIVSSSSQQYQFQKPPPSPAESHQNNLRRLAQPKQHYDTPEQQQQQQQQQQPTPRATKSGTVGGQYNASFLSRQRQGSFAQGQPLPPNMDRPNIGIRF